MGALALSAVVVALSVNVWLFGAGLLDLRLLGHISHTVMAREFGFHQGGRRRFSAQS